jgi:organic radical activating enzyme
MNDIRELLVSIGYSGAEKKNFTLKPDSLRIVLTGGEPLLQIDEYLIQDLLRMNFIVCVETNGSSELLSNGRRQTVLNCLESCREVVVSPKVRDTSLDILRLASCFKILFPIESVVGLTEEIILEFVPHVYRLADLVLQPITPDLFVIHERVRENFFAATRLAVKWGQLHGEEWRIVPQLHRILSVQ